MESVSGIRDPVLMAVSHNVGIPIRFAFGVAETVDLCEQRYRVFAQRFGLDLS
jgi:hypothetical protein